MVPLQLPEAEGDVMTYPEVAATQSKWGTEAFFLQSSFSYTEFQNSFTHQIYWAPTLWQALPIRYRDKQWRGHTRPLPCILVSATWKRSILDVDIGEKKMRAESGEEGGEGREDYFAMAVENYCFELEPKRWERASCGTHGRSTFKQRKQHVQRPWGTKKPARLLVRTVFQEGFYYKQEFSLVRERQCTVEIHFQIMMSSEKYRVLSSSWFPTKRKDFFSFSFLFCFCLFVFFCFLVGWLGWVLCYFAFHIFIHRSLNWGVSQG